MKRARYYVMISNGMGTHHRNQRGEMAMGADFRGLVPGFGPWSWAKADEFVRLDPTHRCVAPAVDVEQTFPASELPRAKRALARAGM